MKKTLTTILGIITILSINIKAINAQQGGPDAYGYIWTDTKDPDPKTTYSWDDISSTGTDIGTRTDDEVKGPYNIGFTFNFYGNDKTEFYIGNNGGILFDNIALPSTNQTIPNITAPDNIIVPFWDNLYTGGSIYYQTKGTAPDRYLVVQYEGINHFNKQTRDLSFQIILFETTSAIKFQYKDVNLNSSPLNNGASATVGIENNTGDIGLQYSYNTNSLVADMAILFEWVNNNPDVPTLVSPADLFIICTNTPTFIAHYSDPDTNPGQINFEIASDSGFTSILASGNSNQVNSGNNTSWIPGSSISDGTRYWHAQAEDIHEATSTWSDHRTITIETIKPITASVTTPANGGNYNQYTMPATFQGKAADNPGGVGLNADSTVFCIKRESDNSYWDGDSWEPLLTLLSTTHNATIGNTEVTWNDDITLPSWTDGTYFVKASARDKATNAFSETQIDFTFTADLPVINNLTLNPPSPFNGSQNIQVTIDFSNEMNTSINPTIKFGTSDPFETYTLSTAGVWSQGVGYDIYTTTMTTTEITTAGSGNYHFNISGAKDESDHTMLVDKNFSFIIDTVKPVISSLTLNPPSPLNGSQDIQVTIDFNEEMDTSVNPTIKFGKNNPYTNYTLSTAGIWSQGAGYDIYTTTMTTTEITTAG
ncbi:MAG: hypothetical protein IMY71_08095, partial [Bacteroidetes bacterium]|nr:hypothetical protein [Bacteroidota bacterium]